MASGIIKQAIRRYQAPDFFYLVAGTGSLFSILAYSKLKPNLFTRFLRGLA
jgi:hypothetical protein